MWDDVAYDSAAARDAVAVARTYRVIADGTNTHIEPRLAYHDDGLQTTPLRFHQPTSPTPTLTHQSEPSAATVLQHPDPRG